MRSMLLKSLEVHNFRNLSGAVSWGKDLNIIYGDNGQGKTCWLEAIYLLATTKSFRTAHLKEAICFNEELAIVRGVVKQGAEISRTLQVTIQDNTKTISVNGKKEAVTRYLGQLHAMAFTADELEVVRGGPEARRKFLDKGVALLHPSYIQALSDYARVIKQKNKLLQDAAEAEFSLEKTRDILSPWNEQLVTLSGCIYRARLDYVERLSASLEKKLFGREEVSIRYVSCLEGKGDLSDYEGLLASRLELRVQAELSAGYALIGAHRDDLEILFDGRDLRTFGSSGQQRSALILLELAAISVYHAWHNDYPLFLMDDVDAELDKGRIGHLLEYLENRTQTFITTSKESIVEQFADKANVFQIQDGKVVSSR
jgi:DNA replication and repair protein RecF